MKKELNVEEITLSEMDIITETEVKGGDHDPDESFEIWTFTFHDCR